MGPPQLQQIPICCREVRDGNGGDRHNALIGLVDQMLSLSAQQIMLKPTELPELQSQIEAVDQQLNQIVCELYGLTKAEIEMVLEDV
ncbi:MAG: hypothetical protein HC899_33075 [Leptolyngbyaceae cyanobacterium SM1_4_3]|nr:hypothetical protein [Leptolyngbyaceae cyanobacterium SM1_4_3]